MSEARQPLGVGKAQAGEEAGLKPLLGISMGSAQAGEDVDVMVVGSMGFTPEEEDDRWQHIANIFMLHARQHGSWPKAAEAEGARVSFSAGQIFYRDKEVEEVRLAIVIHEVVDRNGEVTLQGENGETFTAQASLSRSQVWETDPPPMLVKNGPNDFALHPQDEGRTHFSAIADHLVTDYEQPDKTTLGVWAVWDLEANSPAEPQPESSPPPEHKPLLPVAVGTALVDFHAAELLGNLHHLRLPRRWRTIRRWDDLVKERVEALLEEYGEEAFRRGDGRDALLRRVLRRRGGSEEIALTRGEEQRLKISRGLDVSGYRRVDPKFGREYLVRLVKVGNGYLEVGLSWWGEAGPLVDEWRKALEREAGRAKEEARQGVLFEDMGLGQQRELDAMLTQIRCFDYGRTILQVALGQLRKQARNPIELPALALRSLLDLGGDGGWKAKVEGSLEGLRQLNYSLRSFDLGHEVYGYGSALASWTYVARGAGKHAEGFYYLELGAQFVGCLRAFEGDRVMLRGGLPALTFDWSKKPPEQTGSQARKSRVQLLDAGAPFYDAAEGLTPEQSNLTNFLYGQLTLRKSAVAKGPDGRPWCERSKANDPGAEEPRIYTSAFCPLLPEGRQYHGALGRFARNPEAGRTLGGTRRKATATGGAHSAGLLVEMGYLLETGGATEARKKTVEAALADIRAVVVENLGGVIAACGPNGAWLTDAEAEAQGLEDLLRKTRWFLFVPEDWREARRARYEEQTGLRTTESEQEASAERERLWAGEPSGSSPVGATVGPESLLLHQRLHIAMRQRGLSQTELAGIFGVSRPAVSKWLKGVAPDPDTGKVTGAAIPRALQPWVDRWIATGEDPDLEQVKARRGRRSGRAKDAP